MILLHLGKTRWSKVAQGRANNTPIYTLLHCSTRFKGWCRWSVVLMLKSIKVEHFHPKIRNGMTDEVGVISKMD